MKVNRKGSDFVYEDRQWSFLAWACFAVMIVSAILVVVYPVYCEISFWWMLVYFMPSAVIFIFHLHCNYARKTKISRGEKAPSIKNCWAWGRFLFVAVVLIYGILVVYYMENIAPDDIFHFNQEINKKIISTSRDTIAERSTAAGEM